jgi:transposase-like protein
MKLNQRQLRGLGIVAMGGQIERINDKLFLVRSQRNSGETYRVSWVDGKWLCNCLDAKSGQYCKHRTAIDFLKRLPEVILANQKALVRACPTCGSNSVISKGRRYNKRGSVRIFLCKSCAKKFPEDASSGLSRPALAVASIDLYYRGLSVREIRDHFEQMYGEHRAVSTIHKWIIKVTRLLIQAVSTSEPNAGRKRWLIDEMKCKVSGQWRWTWNVLSAETRVHIVSMITEGRSTREALAVLREAVARAGGPPKELSSDGLVSTAKAARMSGYKMKHIRNVKFKDPINNNQIESLHGTMRAWLKVKRGMKQNTRDLLEGRRIFYNNMRRNLTLGRSPSGADARWVDLVIPPLDPNHRRTRQRPSQI